MEKFDLVVIGGGVIGCASLRACLKSQPGLDSCLIELEQDLALHQSGRNSGVVHVGYNQKPGTLKAKFVVEGSRRLRAYCKEKNLPLIEDGILITARNEEEMDTLKELYGRGRDNGAKVELVNKARILELEPASAGIGGLLAPEGSSFDARSYVKSLSQDAIDLGAQTSLSEKVLRLSERDNRIYIETTRRSIEAKLVIVAAGLHADELAHMMGIGKQFHVFPFRGDYYQLVKGAEMVRAHIYPTPNLSFPFLGVHLSRTFDGRVTAGPGALLAFGRNCYTRFSFQPMDFSRMLASKALWNLLRCREFQEAFKREWNKSVFPSQVLKEARVLVPGLPDDCLVPAPSGIRAQVVAENGELVDDLTVLETGRSIHVLNAVSPALTCSLPFADHIARLAKAKWSNLNGNSLVRSLENPLK